MAENFRKVQVIKRSGGRSPYWYLRWWEPLASGDKLQERWRSTRTTVRKKAEQQRRELERTLESPAACDSAISWDDFEDQFLSHQRARKPSATVGFYTNSLRIFARTATPTTLDRITITTLDDFASARITSGVAPATVNRDLRHLRAALNWAHQRGLIKTVPSFRDVTLREPKKKPTVMPEGDFLALVKAAESPSTPVIRRSGAWWRTFLYMGYYLGLRRGELLALSWRDINFDTASIRVHATSSKSRKERVLPLPDAIKTLLQEWRRAQSNPVPSDPVLPWPLDTLNPIYDDLKLLQDAAGIPADQRYSPKDLRSSCASLMIASSVPTMVVKDFLGHANVSTTENYYVDTDPAMRAVANARSVAFTERDRGCNESADENK